MGYYAEVTGARIKIVPDTDAKIYETLCALNKREDLKSGGSYSDGRKTASWFSWMSENYDETCATWQEIVEELGFDLDINDPNSYQLTYHSKVGDEEHFFRAMAPYIENGSFVSWRGEDGALWQWKFHDGQMEILTGHVERS
jgi:hypothetical protein